MKEWFVVGTGVLLRTTHSDIFKAIDTRERERCVRFTLPMEPDREEPCFIVAERYGGFDHVGGGLVSRDFVGNYYERMYSKLGDVPSDTILDILEPLFKDTHPSVWRLIMEEGEFGLFLFRSLDPNGG